MTRKALTAALCLLLAGSVIAAAAQQEARTPTRRWTEAKARAWAGSQPWALGCNYIPRTAVPVRLSDVGFDGPVAVKDVWSGKQGGVFTGEFAPVIPYHGARLEGVKPTLFRKK